MLKSFSMTLCCLFTAGVHEAGAQGSESASTVTISAKVGGKSYQATGPGSCRHEPTAAIYGVPAALWMVGQSGGDDASIKSMNLTLWKPKNGTPQQFSLSLTTKSSSHRIDVGGRGDQIGSAKASVHPSGPGGRIEVSGKDESGQGVELVVKCAAFAGVEAAGG